MCEDYEESEEDFYEFVNAMKAAALVTQETDAIAREVEMPLTELPNNAMIRIELDGDDLLVKGIGFPPYGAYGVSLREYEELLNINDNITNTMLRVQATFDVELCKDAIEQNNEESAYYGIELTPPYECIPDLDNCEICLLTGVQEFFGSGRIEVAYFHIDYTAAGFKVWLLDLYNDEMVSTDRGGAMLFVDDTEFDENNEFVTLQVI